MKTTFEYNAITREVGGECGEGDRVVSHIHVPVLPVQPRQPPVHVMAATCSSFISFGLVIFFTRFLSFWFNSISAGLKKSWIKQGFTLVPEHSGFFSADLKSFQRTKFMNNQKTHVVE
jgi:hypothetical protein